MSLKSTYLKISNLSVGLQGFSPLNSAPSQLNVKLNVDKIQENKIIQIEKTLTNFSNNNLELKAKLNDESSSISEKSNLIADSFSNYLLNEKKYKIDSLKIKNLTNDIVNNDISSDEYFEKISKFDSRTEKKEIGNIFSNIKQSINNEKNHLKEPIILKVIKKENLDNVVEKQTKNMKYSKKQNISESKSNKVIKNEKDKITNIIEENLKTSKNIMYKNIKVLKNFVEITKTQHDNLHHYKTKVAVFAGISTALTVAATALALYYSARTPWSFGVLVPFSVTSWIQTGLSIYYTTESWIEYNNLNREYNRLNDIIHSSEFVEFEKDIKELSTIQHYNHDNYEKSLKNFYIKKGINVEEIYQDNYNFLLNQSLSDSFWKNVVVSATAFVIFLTGRKIFKKFGFIVKKLTKKTFHFFLKFVSSLFKEITKKLIKPIQTILSGLAIKFTAKKLAMLSTSWTSPIGSIITSIDIIVSLLDLFYTNVFNFQKNIEKSSLYSDSNFPNRYLTWETLKLLEKLRR